MEKVLDLSYLKEISGGDMGFVKEMLELFNNTTVTEVIQFDDLVNAQNWDAVGNLAHKLKAPIQMLGANELFNLVRSLEIWGKEGLNIEKIPEAVIKIKELVYTLSEEITESLKTM